MTKYLVLFAVAISLIAAPAFAARVATVPITHTALNVYQAYPGNSKAHVGALLYNSGINGFCTDLEFLGYVGLGKDVISSVPGVLSIIPGTNWGNFVGANGVIAYGIKNVALKKVTPAILQCADVFPVKTINQQGTNSIRTWWPLMYEIPGTTWTLTILYGTSTAWDDDGPGPNPAGYVHTEVWTWNVDATLASLKNAVELFHELPFGLDEVPLISDELLYPRLQAQLDKVIADDGDHVAAGYDLGDFEMMVMDACIGTSPSFPNPTGLGTGIANSSENPACCKILADVEYIAKINGYFLQAN